MIIGSSEFGQDSKLHVLVSQGIGKFTKHPYFRLCQVSGQKWSQEYNSVSVGEPHIFLQICTKLTFKSNQMSWRLTISHITPTNTISWDFLYFFYVPF
jgi:hypothetical protein